MRVYLRDGSALTILHAATLRQKLQIKLSISPSHCTLAPGQPVPAVDDGDTGVDDDENNDTNNYNDDNNNS